MASKPVMKPEPVDRRKYSALLVTDSNDPSTTNTKHPSAVNHATREPRRIRQSVRNGTVQDGAQKSSEFEGGGKEDDPDTRGRKRARREESKHVARHGVVDLTTEEESLEQTWATMHRELSTGPHAKKLKPSLDAWRDKEMRKLEIDGELKWYAPTTFFSRPARKTNKRTPMAEPSQGHVIHPAIREPNDNQYRRSERNIQKHIAESSRPSGIQKPTKKKKAATTKAKKLDMASIQKGIALGQAQIIGEVQQKGQKGAGTAAAKAEESNGIPKKTTRKLAQIEQNEESKARPVPPPFKRPGTGARKDFHTGRARSGTDHRVAVDHEAAGDPVLYNSGRDLARGQSLTLSIRSRTPAFDR